MNTTLATAHNYGLGGLKLDEVLVADISKRSIVFMREVGGGYREGD